MGLYITKYYSGTRQAAYKIFDGAIYHKVLLRNRAGRIQNLLAGNNEAGVVKYIHSKGQQ